MVPVHDGPLLVRGNLRVLDPERGGVIAEETRIAMCRCGKSENQPFCDACDASGARLPSPMASSTSTRWSALCADGVQACRG
jgi:hypothetical protein